MAEFSLDSGRRSQERAYRYFKEKVPFKTSRTVKTILQYKERTAVVLDVGTGSGQVFSRIQEVFHDSWGLEVSREQAAEANRALTCTERTRVITGSAEAIPFRHETFDVVISNTMIEHVDNPEKMLAETRRVLKDDGILYVTTANKYWPLEPHYFLPFLSYLPPGLANAYVRLFGVAERYDDIHLYSYRGLVKLLEREFVLEDKTLDVIEHFQRYGFHSKRRLKVSILARMLKWARRSDLLFSVFSKVLLAISLGWIIVGKKR